MSALVARVVPCTTARTDPAAVRDSSRSDAMPCSTACAGSFVVVRILPTRATPVASSTTTRSVKVPPMSTPSRDATALSLHWRRDSPGKMRKQGESMMRLVASVIVMGLLSATALAPAPAAQPRRVVTIAAGSVDGVYYPIAGAISRITSETKSLNIRTTVESSGGSLANVQLIRAGEADFALLQNDIAYYAFNGTGLESFAGKPVKSMAGVFSVYPEAVHLVAIRASGVKSVRDLKGKRVAFGPVGSATEQNAMQVLEVHGVAEGDLTAAVRVSFSAAVDQLRAGAVDAAFFSIAVGAPVIADALASVKLSLISVEASAGEALVRKYPFYTIDEIPANTYKNQDREVAVPAVMAMLVARSSLSEDLVYRFTKAVFDNLPRLHSAHAAARSLTLQTALVGMALPLHPGAERFFKEKGIAR